MVYETNKQAKKVPQQIVEIWSESDPIVSSDPCNTWDKV